MTYNIRIDRHLIRAAGGSIRHALVSIVAPQAPPKAGREPLQMSLVLDRSGSMAAPAGAGITKMDLANLGASAAIELLTPNDAVAVIPVDSAPHVIQNAPGNLQVFRGIAFYIETMIHSLILKQRIPL